MKGCEGMQLFKQLFDLVVTGTQSDSLWLKHGGDYLGVHPSGPVVSSSLLASVCVCKSKKGFTRMDNIYCTPLHIIWD